MAGCKRTREHKNFECSTSWQAGRLAGKQSTKDGRTGRVETGAYESHLPELSLLMTQIAICIQYTLLLLLWRYLHFDFFFMLFILLPADYLLLEIQNLTVNIIIIIILKSTCKWDGSLSCHSS